MSETVDGSVDERLHSLGLELPPAPEPVAAYVPWRRAGDTLYTAGQIPVREGQVVYKGHVGSELTLEEGIEAAQLCGLNALAVLKAAGGALERIRLLKVTGFVNSAPGFTDQSSVLNGASTLFARVLGEERGRHARTAVSSPELPLGSAVEVDVIAVVEPG